MNQSPSWEGHGGGGGHPSQHSTRTHRGVIQDDVTAGHVAVKNVFLQVLDEGSLGRSGGMPCEPGCFLRGRRGARAARTLGPGAGEAREEAEL